MIERRPRAPVLRSIALRAIAPNASSAMREVDRFHLEQPLVLFYQRVLRLGQYLLQRRLVEIARASRPPAGGRRTRGSGRTSAILGSWARSPARPSTARLAPAACARSWRASCSTPCSIRASKASKSGDLPRSGRGHGPSALHLRRPRRRCGSHRVLIRFRRGGRLDAGLAFRGTTAVACAFGLNLQVNLTLRPPVST